MSIEQAIPTVEWHARTTVLLDHDPTATQSLAGLPADYILTHTPGQARDDLLALAGLDDPARVSVQVDRGRAAGVRLRLRTKASRMPLHKVLPILGSLGIKPIEQHPFPLEPATLGRIDVLDVELPGPEEQPLTLVVDALGAIWDGSAPADSFNQLVLTCRLSWSQVHILRTYSAYLRQAGMPYATSYLQSVLTAYPAASAALVALFDATFNPAAPTDAAAAAAEAVTAAIAQVEGVDADRIMRAIADGIGATVRTNMYRPDRSPRDPLAIKLHPRALGFLPRPRPRIETFVYGTTVEGTHLRFDRIARGGIRWSDRPEDFRTEVLGLVKAQSVKNAVIVPAGAKGGFVVKGPVTDRTVVETAYRAFISALLDVTDNLDTDSGRALTPPGVVRRDGDDTYLVVAADKGTATFSDTANEVAADHAFWLGDAFASGGTVGYDHKAMGITARGAWESVRRHFRELGVDTQRDPVTVVGIGDMSGDVFGNGLLLSPTVRLVAAFDHRHIFIDPTPDPGRSFRERQRLFTLPRSSWADYAPDMLSDGAIVVSRAAKQVPLTPQARTVLGIDPMVSALSGPELVRAILLAPADLLWNGGVGTYVKASTETHLDCGDKTNDQVRVDARNLRVTVVGEGGNLGLTQRARIEFARHGGRINTDALDNSAGVDCSDHEVNVKIAISQAISRGRLDPSERATLLSAMTDDVAELVLANNYTQNALMGSLRHDAAEMVGYHARIAENLARAGVIDRDVDVLPTAEGFAELDRAGIGLTGPELAHLMAHVKNALHEQLLSGPVPDEAWAAHALADYFPGRLRELCGADLVDHPLRRQIITTTLINQMVDTAGMSFVHRAIEDTGAGLDDIVRAHQVVATAFDLPEVLTAIRSVGTDVPAEAEYVMVEQTQRLIDQATRWFVLARPRPLDVEDCVQRYRPAVAELRAAVPGLLQGHDRDSATRHAQQMISIGAPEDLANRIAALAHQFCLLDITDIAAIVGQPVAWVSRLYFVLSARLGIGRHLAAAEALSKHNHAWSLARLALTEDLYHSLRLITLNLTGSGGPDLGVDDCITAWEERHRTSLGADRTVLGAGGSTVDDLAALTALTRQVRLLIPSGIHPATAAWPS